ncbi:MAG: hypothetical protein ACRDD4_05765 [Culicoidibacterales bacterium]
MTQTPKEMMYQLYCQTFDVTEVNATYDVVLEELHEYYVAAGFDFETISDMLAFLTIHENN